MKSMASQREFRSRGRQHGAILVVSLILLLIMTVLALSVSQTSRMQERMTGNARDSDLSFQAAEAGLRGAEKYLWDQTNQPIACSAAPCTVYQKNVLNSTNLTVQDKDWWATNGQDYGGTGTQVQEVKRDPQFVIEELGFAPFSLTIGKGVPGGRTFYRNTAHGVGGTEAAQTVLETTFTRPY
jgi:type IV pilus assembly protein PilX